MVSFSVRAGSSDGRAPTSATSFANTIGGVTIVCQ